MPGYDDCLIDAELKARAAYSEPHRHYHDQRHLDECLAELDRVRGLSDRERLLLGWAILWHDCVYEPGQRDNEERSAALARTELLACAVDQGDADEVARLIRLTERHRVDPSDALGTVMVSVDLAILGSEPNRYREYAADIRKEYGHVPEELWRSGRALVLKRMLAADPLFPHPGFRDRLERQALANMSGELKTLAEG